MKKRIFNHLLFWLSYLIVNSLFEFTYIQAFFPNTKQKDLIIQAVLINLIIILPKVLFTYFVLYFSIFKALNKKGNKFSVLLITLFALIISMIIYRFLGFLFYQVNPALYATKISLENIFSPVIIFTTLLDIGLISGIAVAIKLFKMQLTNLKKEKNLVRDKLEAELKFLKNQTNPHFLFNTLNNIYAIARKRPTLAPEMILKLSELLRFILYNASKDRITIVEEIRILEGYVDLEKVRFSNRLKIIFNQDIDNEAQFITPLILLPFIENAFKHGPRQVLNDTFIDIALTLINGNLIFSVINSKQNDDIDKATENIGLANVRRQLELMYKEFTLTVRNLGDTFSVKLVINLNKYAAI